MIAGQLRLRLAVVLLLTIAYCLLPSSRIALAATCGTDSSGQSRTVWFRLEDPLGQELR